MTIPAALQNEGLIRQLNEVYDALRKRLRFEGDFRTNAKWTYHDGAPDVTNLPDEDVAVWLMLLNVQQSQEDTTFHAEYFIATWQIEVIVRDAGNDQHGFSPQAGLEAIGSVLDILTKTKSDVSLDDSIDFSNDISIDHGIGRISGGDRLIEDWIIVLRTHLPLINCRDP